MAEPGVDEVDAPDVHVGKALAVYEAALAAWGPGDATVAILAEKVARAMSARDGSVRFLLGAKKRLREVLIQQEESIVLPGQELKNEERQNTLRRQELERELEELERELRGAGVDAPADAGGGAGAGAGGGGGGAAAAAEHGEDSVQAMLARQAALELQVQSVRATILPGSNAYTASRPAKEVVEDEHEEEEAPAVDRRSWGMPATSYGKGKGNDKDSGRGAATMEPPFLSRRTGLTAAGRPRGSAGLVGASSSTSAGDAGVTTATRRP